MKKCYKIALGMILSVALLGCGQTVETPVVEEPEVVAEVVEEPEVQEETFKEIVEDKNMTLGEVQAIYYRAIDKVRKNYKEAGLI